MQYLRFTPEEFRALWRVGHSFDLSKGFLRRFPHTLVEALAATAPALAGRIASFRSHELRILYQYLRDRREVRPRGHRHADWGEPGEALTAEEVQAVSEVCGSFVLHNRFLPLFKKFLLRHFGETSPDLARKLIRLSRLEIERLYEQVTGQNSRGA